MEQNTDRMGFALIALSIVAVVLIIMNTIFGPTVKSYFQGLQKWSDNVMNKLNPPQQYEHTAYAWSSDGKDRFTTTKPNFNLLDGTKNFSGTWIWGDSWTNDGTYNGLMVKKRIGKGSGLYKPYTIVKSGIYTFSTYIKSSSTNNDVVRWVNVNGKDVSPTKGIDVSSNWSIDTFSLTLNAGDIVFVRHEIITQNSTDALWVAGYKVEQGSTATLYMPSQSEATPADGPTYIGTYTDTNEQGSQDPTKYTWTKTN